MSLQPVFPPFWRRFPYPAFLGALSFVFWLLVHASSILDPHRLAHVLHIFMPVWAVGCIAALAMAAGSWATKRGHAKDGWQAAFWLALTYPLFITLGITINDALYPFDCFVMRYGTFGVPMRCMAFSLGNFLEQWVKCTVVFGIYILLASALYRFGKRWLSFRFQSLRRPGAGRDL